MEKLNVNFSPWEGKEYFSAGFNGKKVLILGESHYGAFEGDTDATIDTVNKYLGRMENPNIDTHWMSTYTKLTKICLNKDEITVEEKDEFWDSIIFYNYLSESLIDREHRPTKEQWKKSEDAFYEVLQFYKPDIILIVGEELWNNTPQSNWTLIEPNLGYYTVDNKKIFASSIYHPASHYQYGSKEFDSKTIFKRLLEIR